MRKREQIALVKQEQLDAEFESQMRELQVIALEALDAVTTMSLRFKEAEFNQWCDGNGN